MENYFFGPGADRPVPLGSAEGTASGTANGPARSLALPDAEVIPNPTQPVAAAERWPCSATSAAISRGLSTGSARVSGGR